MKNNQNRYAFYGSLRRNMYNYNAARKGMEYIETKEIPGYKLFSLGFYPCAIHTGDEDDILTVDLFVLTGDEESSIHRMEIGAGYEYKEIEINGKLFGIYVYNPRHLSNLKDRLVPGGDWVKYLQNGNGRRL